MECDMEDLFAPCVRVYAELTRADPKTCPLAGTPYGPELASLEDGQGGPRGEGVHPAEEAIAECLRIDGNVGPEDKVPAVGGRARAADGSPSPRPPALSGVLQL
eukprot:7825465-Pyramimonas_sp.AAC.1